MELIPAHTEQHLGHVRQLFQEYADWLQFDLCFQDFEQELADLPGEYGPPTGCVFLAMSDESVAGCVGVRKFGERVCEMKRLYVRPAFRGQGIGRRLATVAIETARELGYECMRLDTVASMTAAMSLYESLGFANIEPYRHNPIEGARYMELTLGVAGRPGRCGQDGSGTPAKSDNAALTEDT